MSTHLYWQPVQPHNGKSVDGRLKDILKRRYRIDNCKDPIKLNSAHCSYLLGLRDAGIPDADTLIAAIEKHGEIQIWIDE